MRKTDKKVLGMAMVVEMLAFDKDLRTRFLDDAGDTLQELGVTVRDRRLLDQIAERIKHLIEAEILVPDGIDPIGPVATIGTAVITGVVTGVSTGAAVAVANVTTSHDIPWEEWEEWDKIIQIDFGRVYMLQKQMMNEQRMLALERQVQAERVLKS